MDPITCCLLGLCCPPFSAEQREIFEKLLTQHLGDADKAKKITDAVYDDFAAVTKRLRELMEEK